MLPSQVSPIGREDENGENESEHDVHNYAGAEGGERPASRRRQIANARRQADAEEAEDERTGPQILDRGEERRRDGFIEFAQTVASRGPGHDQRRRQETKHEFGETAPD